MDNKNLKITFLLQMPLLFLKNLDTNQEMNGLKTKEQFLKFVILLFYQKKELTKYF